MSLSTTTTRLRVGVGSTSGSMTILEIKPLSTVRTLNVQEVKEVAQISKGGAGFKSCSPDPPLAQSTPFSL